MTTYVIPVDDVDRIDEFLKEYKPILQSEVEQIGLLKKKIAGAVIVPVSKLARTIVTMYSTVRLLDLSRREVSDYTIVYSKHASNSLRRLSVLSPLGCALLGCEEGDVFECATPHGPVTFGIREILFQPQWERENRLATASLR